MYSTRVGYAGGKTKNPTYYTIGDHSETIEIMYDPTVISYRELLDIFWNSHNPYSKPYSKQYMSIIFYHTPEQRNAALQTIKEQEKSAGKKIYTRIEKAVDFYEAETYHQKYTLKQYPDIMGDLLRYYSGEEELTRSAAAAKINGYLAGEGTVKELKEILPLLGLSKRSEDRLLKRASR